MTDIKWGIGTTINVGNFSNLKYEVEVTDTVRDGESISAASKRVFDFVEQELDSKINGTKEELADALKDVTDAAQRLTGK